MPDDTGRHAPAKLQWICGFSGSVKLQAASRNMNAPFIVGVQPIALECSKRPAEARKAVDLRRRLPYMHAWKEVLTSASRAVACMGLLRAN